MALQVDYGLGNCANSLELGCDCLGHIQYFDGVLSNSKGASCCLHNTPQNQPGWLHAAAVLPTWSAALARRVAGQQKGNVPAALLMEGSLRMCVRMMSSGMAAGEPVVVKKVVCMHEEDHGLLWKHVEYRCAPLQVLLLHMRATWLHHL